MKQATPTLVIDLVPNAQLLELLLVAGEEVLERLLVLNVLLLGEDLGGDGVMLEVGVDLLRVEDTTAPGRGIASKVSLKLREREQKLH